MNGDWKEFHLVAEPVVREIAPGMKAHLWGYNGQSPGPTIEAVEGDKVRIFVTNKLPEHTTVHWHGMLLPNGMDGVGGLTQPHIKPGKTFVYEFVLQEERHLHVPPARRRDGADGDGHDGLLRHASARSEVHARRPRLRLPHADAYDIDPGSYVPKVMTMTDFNLWTWNSRVFPGIDPLVARKGDRVRIRDRQSHHDQPSDPPARPPLRGHLHRRRLGAGKRALAGGHDRRSGRRDARDRIRRRRAGRLGDPLPQVAPHHERDGPRREDLHRRRAKARPRQEPSRKLVPDYMPMGSRGMAEMGEMEMPMPDNTLPMMTGFGQFGPLEMGGMFSVVKVREGLARRRLQGPRLVQASAGHRGLRIFRAAGDRSAAPKRHARANVRKSKSMSSSRGRIPARTIIK